jgi:K+-sensing histidine kinase KdpD
MRHLVLAATLVAACLVSGLVALNAADKADDSAKAAVTRQLLKTKVSVDYKDTTLTEIVDDLKEQIKEKKKKTISVLKDNKGGVSNNTKFTYKADNKPLEEVLDEMFKKNDLGYIVISQKGNAYDGALKIVKGKARGYAEKKD